MKLNCYKNGHYYLIIFIILVFIGIGYIEIKEGNEQEQLKIYIIEEKGEHMISTAEFQRVQAENDRLRARIVELEDDNKAQQELSKPEVEEVDEDTEPSEDPQW